MPLSANTLIHFTANKDYLRQILEENFRISFCKETVLFKDSATIFYAPMVSFCDIPLSEVKEHISKYGNYGIGFTKQWGAKRGLNPVLYLAQNSMLSVSYEDAFNHFIGDTHIVDLTKEQKALVDVIRYCKNYEADLTRKGKVIPDYRFSDEREWRYVPSYSEPCPMVLIEDDYLNNKVAFDALLENLRLEFEPNDIKYIIINDDSEIAEFVDHLRKAKGKKYSYHDVERLTTRILTTEQIMEDM